MWQGRMTSYCAGAWDARKGTAAHARTFSMSVDHVMVRSSIGWSLSAGTMTIWKDGMAAQGALTRMRACGGDATPCVVVSGARTRVWQTGTVTLLRSSEDRSERQVAAPARTSSCLLITRCVGTNPS